MLNIDVLVLGNEFKSDSGDTYKVKTHFAEGENIHIELEKVVPVQEEELLELNE